ncbi:hypothetical protein ACIGB8_12015 [Promicromonospora sukumoe]
MTIVMLVTELLKYLTARERRKASPLRMFTMMMFLVAVIIQHFA